MDVAPGAAADKPISMAPSGQVGDPVHPHGVGVGDMSHPHEQLQINPI